MLRRMLLSEWALLGFAVWTVLLLLSTIGLPRVIKVMRREAPPNSFNPAVPHGSEFYQRCMRAHMNCVENLPVFASLVLLGSSQGMAETAFQVAALAVLPARMGQTVAHISSGRNRVVVVRFYFYVAQVICFLVMGALLALHGWQKAR